MLTVRLSAPGPDDLRSLDDWLRGEERLRGRIRLVPAPPRPGELGTADEELLVTLADAAQNAALAETVEIWLRHRGTDVTLQVRIGDRPPVTLVGDGTLDVAVLLKAAVEAAGG
ncbi:effector-associated constant component EACC1 [Actinocorallia longicatena]|uniref:Uncharacterized protein n=1 Tax=Actinocorallia longicatena TaxID=111803 RepID=A0ABP6QHY9_9ACTN